MSSMHDAAAVKMSEAAPGAAAMQTRSGASDPKNWMEGLSDETLLCDINLPGTHDSGAINAWAVRTPYACQDRTITQQLDGGIRVLDIRLKAKQKKQKDDGYEIVICHGWLGLLFDLNEYESFASVLKECNDFLATHQSEAVVMILKFDDGWPKIEKTDSDEVKDERTKERLKILGDLDSILEVYPDLYLKSKAPEAPKHARGQKDLATLKEARGKIVLFQRINGDLRFGTPISWPDNTAGEYGKTYINRSYKVYVQDHCDWVWVYSKISEVWSAALEKKNEKAIFLNFVSATMAFGSLGLYVNGEVLDKFGAYTASGRPEKFGWMLFDYAFTAYPVSRYQYVSLLDFIIASNSRYVGYEDAFSIERGL
jgi:hypothetical protein